MSVVTNQHGTRPASARVWASIRSVAICAASAAIAGTLLASGCGHPMAGHARAVPPVAVRFVDVTSQAGIHFQHNNGAHGKKYMPETVGSGIAFLDYDNDGWQDVLLINGTNWPRDPDRHTTLKLYQNRGDGTFADVTHESGLDVELYGMGVAVGDYDNDGWEDIYITALGPNHLFHNELGRGYTSGTPRHRAFFHDVSVVAGVAGVPVPESGLRWKWSTSAAWFDYDRDGKLDLFVCNYVHWSPETDVFCGDNGRKSYCAPTSYIGVCCTLYHNEGNGRFRDVSEETNIRTPKTAGKSFSVAIADYNGDGWPDIAVTNDTWPNFLFINQQGKKFVEQGVEAGIAFGESGKAKAGMGIDAGDWNNNGRFGLLVGNFTGESLSLLENDGTGLFTDRSHAEGLGSPSLLSLSFGLFWFDYDLDGSLDALIGNGHIDDFIKTMNSQLSYRERPLLFHNDGHGRFTDRGQESGLTQPLVARGAAYADIDNDGDLDVALLSNGERFVLYRNEGVSANHWIRFRTVGTRSNRDGIGAIVHVTHDRVVQTQTVHSGGSFLSESQHQPTFGLLRDEAASHVEVVWPDGAVEKADNLAGNAVYVVTEGQGFTKDLRGSGARIR